MDPSQFHRALLQGGRRKWIAKFAVVMALLAVVVLAAVLPPDRVLAVAAVISAVVGMAAIRKGLNRP